MHVVSMSLGSEVLFHPHANLYWKTKLHMITDHHFLRKQSYRPWKSLRIEQICLLESRGRVTGREDHLPLQVSPLCFNGMGWGERHQADKEEKHQQGFGSGSFSSWNLHFPVHLPSSLWNGLLIRFLELKTTIWMAFKKNRQIHGGYKTISG